MEDFDILNKFDNDKLIDVVKNYKRYGYDDELRDYAINLLGERGWNITRIYNQLLLNILQVISQKYGRNL